MATGVTIIAAESRPPIMAAGQLPFSMKFIKDLNMITS
jgi:hypothetical protein